jgi:3D (Asp-Asp-Asp) domain-containing protein
MSRQPNGGFIGKENITDNTTASGVYTLSDVARKVADNEYPPARFTPSRSLRFRQSASAYLSRTPASVGNRKTWTWSAWFKRGLLGGTQVLFEATDASGTTIRATNRFGSDAFIGGDSSSGLDYGTTQIFRDSSAWYHIIIAMDTTQAISSNRFKLYINGFQVTAFSSITYPTLNADTLYNSSSHFNYIGATRPAFAQYFDGYMSEINFVDGQALTPAAFGESDPRTGEWKPKRYAGTYGTNGFYLSFANNASTTTLGLDDGTGLAGSGAGSNDWTLNNFSLTAGTTYDSMVDVPGVGSAVINDTGGVVRGNYNTFNPVNFLSDASLNLTDGNLNFGPSGTGTYVQAGTTIAVSSGKFYFEYVPVRGNTDVGSGASAYPIWNLVPSSSNITSSSAAPADATRMNLGTLDGDGGTYMCAVDFDNGYVYRGRNGTWSNSATLSSIINGTGVGVVATFTPNKEYIFTVVHRDPGPGGGGGSRANANFGQRPFAYTPPAGFKTLNTTNLPEPTVKRPQEHFDVKLWNGNNAGQTIGNTAKQRDNYEISRSLRFNASDSPSFSRTPSATGNQKTFTFSAWVKRSSTSSIQTIFGSPSNETNSPESSEFWLNFSASNAIDLRSYVSNVGYQFSASTSSLFSDTSAWYHITNEIDTTNATSIERIRLYVNGVRQTLIFSEGNYHLKTQTLALIQLVVS